MKKQIIIGLISVLVLVGCSTNGVEEENNEEKIEIKAELNGKEIEAGDYKIGMLGKYVSPYGKMLERFEKGEITQEELDKFLETYDNSLYDPLPPPKEALKVGR